MNPLPSGTNLDFFIGKTLDQVCIGANEVILNFGDYTSISIECDFLIQDQHAVRTPFEDSRSAASALAQLIAEAVQKVSSQEDGTLKVWFTRGDILEIYDTWEMYESYVIQHHDTFYVV